MKNYIKLDQQAILESLFHPRQEALSTKPVNSHDITITVENDVTLGCRLFLKDNNSPTLLFFHGNGETVSDYSQIAKVYNDFNINFFVATYRGYGWSSGTPSVTSMISDCKRVFDEFGQTLDRLNITGPIFIMGRSLGCVCAIELCSSSPENVKGLIIESGFADTLPLLNQIVASIGAHQISEEDGFGNREKIAQIKLPTLILHGAADEIISVAQAERLQSFSGARTKKFFVIPGAGHNEMISCGGEHYFSTIQSFINEVTGQNSWREKRRKHRHNGGV
jgi:alpha-beta hydrolase superfamily lysophospholipase